MTNFFRMMSDLRGGATLGEVEDALQRAVCEAMAAGEPASVVLRFSIQPQCHRTDRTMSVSVGMLLEVETPDPPATTLFVSQDGRLWRTAERIGKLRPTSPERSGGFVGCQFDRPVSLVF